VEVWDKLAQEGSETAPEWANYFKRNVGQLWDGDRDKMAHLASFEVWYRAPESRTWDLSPLHDENPGRGFARPTAFSPAQHCTSRESHAWSGG